VTNISSMAFTISAGIGIDYFIHSFYLRRNFSDFISFSKYCLVLFFGMFTSTVVPLFIIYVFSDVKGVKDFVAGSIISLTIILILSIVLAWITGQPSDSTKQIASQSADMKRHNNNISGFLLLTINKLYDKASMIIVFFFIVVFIISLFFASKIEFKREMVYYPPFYKEVVNKLGFFPSVSYVFSEDITGTVEKLKNSDIVGHVSTIMDWLPKENPDKVERILSGVKIGEEDRKEGGGRENFGYSLKDSFDQLSRALLAIKQIQGVMGLVSERRKVDGVMDYIKRNWYEVDDTNRIDNLSISALKLLRNELSSALKTKYPRGFPDELEREFGKNGTCVWVFPKKYPTSDKERMEYVSVLKEVSEDNFASWEAVFIIFNKIVKREFIRYGHLLFLVVPLILFFYFRSVIPALLSVISLAFGISVGLCVLKTFGGYIDLTTPLALSLIFGTGVDDFIAVYNAFRRGRISGVIKLFRPTFLTSFTTTAAGIGLLFSYFEQSRYFGLFLAVSMMSVWFANLFLVPTILVMMKQMKIK